jgi:hypothetical protein
MGELIDLNSRAITDADIPAAIARDQEYLLADAAHANATDPHAQYLNQTRGSTQITAAINTHLAASDPHPQYRQSSSAYFTSAPLPTANIAGNSIAFSWNSVQSGFGIAEICNYAGLGGGDAFNFFRMGGNAVASPTLSHRVSRIDVAGSYIQVSDKRLKSNFSSAPGLEALIKLEPLRYTHWECQGFDEKNQTLKLGEFFTHKLGFLAQDVQKILPEAVQTPASLEELYGIDYNCILACAVQAIKDLELRVKNLES